MYKDRSFHINMSADQIVSEFLLIIRLNKKDSKIFTFIRKNNYNTISVLMLR